MKHRTVATILILLVFIFLMTWSFGSSAANPNEPATENNALPENDANEAFEQGEEKGADADLGKFGSRLSREEYLRERDEYIGLKRGYEAGRPFNPEVRRDAIDQMERQEKGRRLEQVLSGDLTPAAGGAWIPIGPTSITNGQSLAQNVSTAVSGRVTSVVVDPANSSNVYLGTAQGGVWRSLNAGTTWESIFDSADSLAIGALALAPSDPTKLYVGTGEFNGCADCFFGAGLYRIDNVDTTPSLVGPINPSQTVGNLTYNVFNGRGITKIVVDPTNAATIFVSTGRGIGGSGSNPKTTTPPVAPRGVWRSTNATNAAASISFQRLLVNDDAGLDTPNTGNADVTDIVMEPGVPNNLLVAVIGQTLTKGGIYRTTNALAAAPTFTQVYAAATGVRLNLTINKVGAIVTAYAATSESASGTNCTSTSQAGVVRKQVNPFNLADTWDAKLGFGGGFCGSQCFYDIAIAVNPTDASEVYLGGSARGTGGCSDGMKKTTDGFAAAGNTARDDTGLHADAHALFFDPVGNVYAGNDGGIWKRSTCASAGTAWTNLNHGLLNTLQFESIAVHPTDQFMMIGGTQDNGTEFQQTSSGNWSNAEGGDGGYSLIDQSATNTTNVTMYHTFFNNNTQMGFDRIVNTACLPIKNSWPTRGVGFVGGADAEDTSPVPCDGTAGYLHNGLLLTSNVLFYAPMALGPGTPNNTVYFGSDRLYRSSDRGDTMTVVSQAPLAGTSPISTIGISKRDDNVRVVGLQNGQVFATSAGSSTLVDLAPPIPANPTGSITNKFIGRAMIDPNNKDVAYITLSYYAPAGQGIWKITNLVAAAGASPAVPAWTASGNGIPSIPINAFAIDPIDSNSLYAGTDIGVYFSSDGGANWSPFGTGLPKVAVFDLQIQPTSRILRAATHGRGVFEISIAGATITPPPSPPTPVSATNPIDTADTFVRQHYSDFLGRSPDSSGLAFWTNQIMVCRCDPQCTEVHRINVSASFFLSIEFQQTGYLVERAYKVAFGNAPNATSTFGGPHSVVAPIVRLNEFAPDLGQIGQGVVVLQPGWETVLENNKVAYFNSFAQRTIFISKYPASTTPTAFVDALFANAGVTPSAPERSTAIGEFGGAANISNAAARGKALRDVAENPSLSNAEFNRAFVLMQYFGYLRRDPNSGQDTDYTGYDFWLTKLNQFSGNYIDAEMVKAFISSIEYRQRFGQ